MKEFNLTTIREQARKEKMGLGDAEKDYVLSVMLVELSRLPEAENLVFKGGTCLKKVYFPEYRFSSDLDFTVVENIAPKLKTKVIETFQNKEIGSVQFLKAIDKTEKDKNTLRLSMQYESKVASFQGKRQVDSVWLDFNFESKVSIKPELKSVILPSGYSLANSAVYTLDLREILAEKISAVYNRPKPRDVYDLWFLLNEKTQVDLQIVKTKLEKNHVDFSLKTLQERLVYLKSRWKKDMTGLLQQIPDYDVIAREVLQNIEKVLKE